jgi:hypothetical protein
MRPRKPPLRFAGQAQVSDRPRVPGRPARQRARGRGLRDADAQRLQALPRHQLDGADQAIWGRQSRRQRCATRASRRDATHLENRVGEPLANPYLYMASRSMPASTAPRASSRRVRRRMHRRIVGRAAAKTPARRLMRWREQCFREGSATRSWIISSLSKRPRSARRSQGAGIRRIRRPTGSTGVFRFMRLSRPPQPPSTPVSSSTASSRFISAARRR